MRQLPKDIHAFYSTQSSITDPGEYGYLFDDLPDDLEMLSAVVRGLQVHFASPDAGNFAALPIERKIELNLRRVDRMLQRMLELDDRPLTEQRPLEKRLLNCCRDVAVLVVSMLRHKGIPARVRFGFEAFVGDYGDHVLPEYWDVAQDKWVLFEPHFFNPELDKPGAMFEIPAQKFPLAATVWQRCRSGEADPNDFGYPSDPGGPPLRGLWVVREYLVHDIAALNKYEMQISDKWGLANIPDEFLRTDDLVFLDQAAELTLAGNEQFAQLRALYRDPRLRVPEIVHHFDIARGDEMTCDDWRV